MLVWGLSGSSLEYDLLAFDIMKTESCIQQNTVYRGASLSTPPCKSVAMEQNVGVQMHSMIAQMKHEQLRSRPPL